MVKKSIPKSKAKEKTGFPLRLPPDLYEKIVEISEEQDRSINKQIISWIRDGIKTFEKESE